MRVVAYLLVTSAALLTAATGNIPAQGTKPEGSDPVGKWRCEYEVGGQQREATLAVKKDGDKLSGTMTYQDKQESKLKDVTFKKGELVFLAEREINDMKFTINYRLKVEGDNLTGKAAADIGGEIREFDIKGKRQK